MLNRALSFFRPYPAPEDYDFSSLSCTNPKFKAYFYSKIAIEAYLSTAKTDGELINRINNGNSAIQIYAVSHPTILEKILKFNYLIEQNCNNNNNHQDFTSFLYKLCTRDLALAVHVLTNADIADKLNDKEIESLFYSDYTEKLYSKILKILENENGSDITDKRYLKLIEKDKPVQWVGTYNC